MNVIVKKKDSFDCVQLNGVKNIAFSSSTYTITKSDNTTVSYASASYYIFILV